MSDAELIEDVAKWIADGRKSDLPYQFHAKEIINLVREHDAVFNGYVAGEDNEFESGIRADERAKTIEACLEAFNEQMDLLEIASGDSGDRIVIDTCRELGSKVIKGVTD